MEKLEEKIQKILKEDSAIIALSKVTVPRIAKQIAQEVESFHKQEVKDIAIAFAIDCQNYMDLIPRWNKEDVAKRFENFITNYYK